MKTKNIPQPTITVPPIWPIIIMCIVGGIWSGLLSALDIQPVRFDTSYRGLSMLCWLAAPIYWKRYQFDTEGFTYSRCELFRKRVLWCNVTRIIDMNLGSKRSSRDVTIIIMDTIEDNADILTKYSAKDFIWKYRKHIFVIDYFNRYQKSQVMSLL